MSFPILLKRFIYFPMLLLGGFSAFSQPATDHFLAHYDSLFKSKQYDIALQLAIDVLQSEKQQNRETSTMRAYALGKVGQSFGQKGKLQQSDSLFSIAVHILRQNDSSETLLASDIWNNFATTKYYLSDFHNSLLYYSISNNIRTKYLGESNVRSLSSLSGICYCYFRLGNIDSLAYCAQTGIETIEKKGMTALPVYIDFLTNLANCYALQGRYQLATHTYLKCKSITIGIYGRQSSKYCVLLTELFTTYLSHGNTESAAQVLAELMELSAYWKNNYKADGYKAAIIYKMGYLEAALKYFQSDAAATLARKGSKSLDYINSITSIGTILNQLERYSEADSLYRKSLELHAKSSSDTSWHYLKAEVYLASLRTSQKQYPQADSLLILLEKKAKKYFPNNAPLLDEINYENLYLAFRQQNWIKASMLIDSLLAGTNIANSSYHSPNTYLYKSKVQLACNAPLVAQAALDSLFLIAETQYLLLSNMLTDEEASSSNLTYKGGIEILANLTEQYPELGNGARLTKQIIRHNDILNDPSRKINSLIKNSNDTALVSLHTKWLDIREQYAQTQLTHNQKYTKRAAHLKNQADSIEVALYQKNAKIIGNSSHTEWLQIRDALQASEAAIAVFRFNEFSNGKTQNNIQYAFSILLPNAVIPKIVFLKNGNELESFILGQYQNEIDLKKDLSPILYEKIWAPIAPYLTGVKTLYFSPDGIFHKINLNTIRAPAGTYLLDNLQIRQVTSLNNLLNRSPDNSGTIAGTALLLGNPAFEYAIGDEKSSIDNPLVSDAVLQRSLLEDSRRKLQLTPLPGSEREVKGIAQKLRDKHWDATVLTGNEATEEAIKQVRSPKVLHIATHGYFLNTEKKGYDQAFAKDNSNPALRSMLFLAGAQNTIDGKNIGRNDGILTAYEAMVLDLDETELVVLSACNTGLGKILNGEGVFGLQRAFRIAGARSLIMSLWNVEDAATELLMNAFYENWLSGQSKTEAFRRAQQSLREKYPQPFYWGSFILVNG